MKIGSLFAGIVGIDLAFIQAGFEVAWANEIDPDACKTYRHNFPDTKLIEGDIRKLDATSLEKVDVLTAGFPCQSFSVCGNQKGFKDARGNLFFEIMRIADELQPTVIFLENVANLTEHDNGRTFNVIHNELASRDYFIRYLIADACDYGIPQHRTRTYIVAFKSKEACDNFKFPKKCKLEKRIVDIIDRTQKADDKYYLAVDSAEYKKLKAAMKDSEQIYRLSDYGIQTSKDGICFTLKANMGTWKDRVPFIKDNYGIRMITPQECLDLMGFPKEYSFPDIVLQKEQYKQCGNSVVVHIIQAIAKKMISN